MRKGLLINIWKGKLQMAKRKMSKVAMIAKEIRKELKEKFPATKFSVRSSNYSGGGSVTVRWTDFPTVDAVKKVTEKHESYRRDYATGEILMGGNYFVFEKQEISDDLKKKVEERMPEGSEDENPMTINYWFNDTMNEMYEEVKGLYEGEHHHKRNRIGKKQKANKIQVKEENKEKPATKKQLYALHCITGFDTRNWNLTRQQASDMIVRSKNGEDIKTESIVH